MPHPKLPNLTVLDHPLIQHKLSILRDKNTPTRDFKQLVNEIAMLMAYEVTEDLPLETAEVETPLERMRGVRVAGKKLALVPILRAGLGMVEGIAQLIPSARVGHIGIYREHDTLEPVDYYFKIPSGEDARDFFVLDPMLATGGSAADAVSALKHAGAQRRPHRHRHRPARARPGHPRPPPARRAGRREGPEPALPPRPRRPLRRHPGRRAAGPARDAPAGVGPRARRSGPPPHRRLGRGLRPGLDHHAPRAHRPRDGRPLLSRSPGRDGPRQAAAPGVRVRRLRPRARAARQLLLRVVLELDPPPAAYRHPAAAGRPSGRRGPARRRSQRDFPPRPPHGLAPRGRRG